MRQDGLCFFQEVKGMLYRVLVVDNSNLTPDQQSALVCNLLNERLAAL